MSRHHIFSLSTLFLGLSFGCLETNEQHCGLHKGKCPNPGEVCSVCEPTNNGCTMEPIMDPQCIFPGPDHCQFKNGYCEDPGESCDICLQENLGCTKDPIASECLFGGGLEDSSSSGPTASESSDAESDADSSTDSETSSGESSSTFLPSLCGNGLVESGEDCDDGNLDETDECTSACEWAICGDGFVQVGVEECDEGASNSDDAICTKTCKNAICGDGKVWENIEQCDDGNKNSSDACINTCQAAYCGDGFVWSGMEECDDANDVPNDSCDACKFVHRLVFASSLEYKGNLGGLTGADAKCQVLAASAVNTNPMFFAGKDPESFKAWISDGNEGPDDRFDTNFTGIYELPGKEMGFPITVVRGGWKDLTDGSLESEIFLDENATPLSSTIWTNTKTSGFPATVDHCDAWTSSLADDLGFVGTTISASAQWTDDPPHQACSATARIYCFEDLP